MLKKIKTRIILYKNPVRDEIFSVPGMAIVSGVRMREYIHASPSRAVATGILAMGKGVFREEESEGSPKQS